MTQDFSGQNLRGRNFKDQDLTGANFSYADIRGANFTGAKLIGANFTKAKAGLQRRWVIVLVIFSLFLAIIAVILASLFGSLAAYILFPKQGYPGYFWDFSISQIGILLSVMVIFIVLIVQRSIEIALGISIVVGCVTAFITQIVMTRYDSYHLVWIASTITPVISIVSVALALALAVTWVKAGIKTATWIWVGSIAVAIVTTPYSAALVSQLWASNRQDFWRDWAYDWAWIRSMTIVMAMVISVEFLGSYICWCTLGRNDNKFSFIRSIAIAITTIKGTSFRGADLTDANFTKAILKNTDFRSLKDKKTNLTSTCFYESQQLILARVSGLILANQNVLNLLVSGNGREKYYIGANLRGANLIGADLSGANLKGANITDATFQGANLETVNLTLTEAIGTDFTRAQMTGACVEAWNIESNTKLDNVDCRFIYLLESSKPGTDDRERRPSSGEFAPGEFTKLFQEVLTTVDLIFRNGVDWKAFIPAFQQVQVENEDTELTIQSIENKGDGVVVVRVSVPPDTNKEKIHREFTQNYEVALKAIEEKYQAKLESKDEQITVYRQQLEDSRQREIQQSSNMEKIIDILAKPALNIPVNESEVQAIAEGPTAVNLVILTLLSGDFETGFPFVIAQIWTEDERLPTQHSGQLPPAPDLVEFYHLWHSQYNRFIEPLQSSRMERKQGNLTNFSQVEIHKLAEELEEKLNKWLNAEQFIPIDRILREKFNRSDEVRIIIQSQSSEVRKLPWHLWDFLKPYRKAEIALSSPFYDRPLKTAVTRDRIRILSILGCDKEINLNKDQQLLAQLDAETSFLVKRNRQELDERLWDEKGWDILCFSGHSSSEMDSSTGYIYINDTDKLSIPDLKNALSTAIERGLQIAIFNSCDGLGLANQLAELHIPQIIVFREPVPDVVAQEFLKNFLTAFASGKSFYLAVREARERLQSLEDRFPCASWLPVICQNPAEVPPTWHSLRHKS